MRKYRLPPLNALRAFEAAARHSSIRLAAEELGVSQSAVSHQVRELEYHLGMRLFERDGRGVRPSEGGRILLPFLIEGFDSLARGIERACGEAVSGELSIQIYVTMAVRWLIPRLARLEERLPGVHLRLHTTQHDWDLERSRAEVGVLLVRGEPAKGLHHAELYRSELLLLCAPGLTGHGAIDLATLMQQPRLRVRAADADWEALFSGRGVDYGHGSLSSVHDSYLVAMEAASEGRGVALIPDFLAERDIADGKLVEPDRAWRVEQPGTWCLVWSDRIDGDPRLQALETFLRDELRARR